MKYYNVKFTFEIPVAVRDDEEDVDAYYAVRDKFGEFTLNEASIKIEPIDQAKFANDSNVIDKLHNRGNDK